MSGRPMAVLVRLSILLAICHCATSLIVPEEIPTVLSLIYSNIPPIKKGTDSRVGVGFRLGEHADFQIVFELGPQVDTEPLSKESNRRRDVMLQSAMRGELGPVAQAVARYQTERRILRELEMLKRMQQKLKKVNAEISANGKQSAAKESAEKTNRTDWLTKWSDAVSQTGEDPVPSGEDLVRGVFANNDNRRIGQPISERPEDKLSQLTKLYESQTDDKPAESKSSNSTAKTTT